MGTTGTTVEVTALHFRDGAGSDKLWGGALVVDERGATFVSCWGKRGSSLQSQSAYGDRVAMRKKYETKMKEKVADGYSTINPNDYGILNILRGASPTLDDALTVEVLSQLNVHAVGPDTQSPLRPTAQTLARVIVSHVTPIRANITPEQYIESPAWAMTEKVNGVRFPIEKKGDQLIGYNRKGFAQYDVPEGALALRNLNMDCLIDGERMEGQYAGQYVMFDLLEVYGESIRHRPYSYRIELLESMIAGMYRIESFGNPTVTGMGYIDPNLRLLTPAISPGSKRKYFDRIEQNGGEGVVFRRLEGPSVAGNTPNEIKVKFTCEIDALICSTNLSKGTASLNLGLIRPSDHQVIDIGSVRAGLTDADVALIEDRLRNHYYMNPPGIMVIKVSFLKARTVGVKLVEPTAWLSDIRDVGDKSFEECTTDQLIEIFGEARREAILFAGPAVMYAPTPRR